MANRSTWWLALTALIWLSQPARAQDPPRTLPVPAAASWQHAVTGMILPPAAAGLTRGAVVDRTQKEQDVSTEYRSADSSLVATVYLYQTMLPDTAVWFDRAMTAILLQPRFGLAGTGAPTPSSFARPGSTGTAGLRAVLAGTGTGIRSTALAVAPLGKWLVKVRMSSTQLEAAALDARLTAFIEALRWPAEAKPPPAAAPIQPCATTLSLKRAKPVREDMSNMLVNLLAGAIEPTPQEGEEEAPPPVHCRDRPGIAEYGVYRPGGDTNRYILALGDAGVALSVAPSLGAFVMGGKARVALTLLDRDTSAVLPSFNRLPPPEQAFGVLSRPARASATARD